MKQNQVLNTSQHLTLFGIDIEITASDEVGGSGMNRVEFYIDGSLKHTASSPPYIWTWDEKTFFKHTIKVAAYDNVGNSATDEITVWKFF